MGPATGEARHAGLPLARDLRNHGDNIAIVCGDQRLTYSELADRVDDVIEELFTGERRFVLLTASFDVGTAVHLLAALASGHPVFVAPADDPTKLKQWVQHYDPDIVITQHHGDVFVQQRRSVSAHELHPDLAMLVSTSGSTGSPKLVRLSTTNIQTNAEQIASALGITSGDRALTALPMAYVYGFSVITTHLLRGATLVLNDTSIVDECFWSRAEQEGITSFAGVPYTYELLDRLGPRDRLSRLTALRQITVAGGRCPPHDVSRYVHLAQDLGFDFAAMYGQSEATARISIARLPELLVNPATVGAPLPGTTVTIDSATTSATDDAAHAFADDVGELVFTGPNLMLGYAWEPADFALGRTIDELRTGDLARIDEHGRIEIVGREQRFSKIYGLRVDLQRIEDGLHADGITAHIVNDDHRLMVIAETADPDHVADEVCVLTGLPTRAVEVTAVEALPRTSSGKLDYVGLKSLAAEKPEPPPVPVILSGTATVESLRAEFARCLGRPDATVDDSFASLGGDSLSHVEMSVRLERALGTLPAAWPGMSMTELASLALPVGDPGAQVTQSSLRWSSWRRMDTTVLIRALAILAVVAGHITLTMMWGGAFLLIAVAGYNVARFLLTDGNRRLRTRNMVRATAAFAVPSVLWIWIVTAFSDQFTWPNALLINHIVGTDVWSPQWKYWFVETLLVLLVLTTALTAMPWFDRAERRWPFTVPIALVLVALTVRYDVFFGEPSGTYMYTPLYATWLFALGWAAQRAATWQERLVVVVLALAVVPGAFESVERSVVVTAGLLVLLFVRTVRVPSIAVTPIATVASASLWIYLTHWQVFPYLRPTSRWLAFAACVGVGVAMSAAWTRAVRRARPLWQQRSRELVGPLAGRPEAVDLRPADTTREHRHAGV